MNILLKALWLPIKHYRQVMKIFWPVFVVGTLIIAISILAIIPGIFSPYLASAISNGLFVYLALLLSMGCVKWHRFLIRDEQVSGFSLVPDMLAVKYLGRVLILLVSLFLCVLVFLIILQIVLSYILRIGDVEILPATLTYLVGVLVFSFFWRTSIFILPAIADERDLKSYSPEIVEMAGGMGTALSIFIVATVFSGISGGLFLLLAVVALMPEGFPNALDALQIMALSLGGSVLFFFYGMLTFTALLSVFYRKIIPKH